MGRVFREITLGPLFPRVAVLKPLPQRTAVMAVLFNIDF